MAFIDDSRATELPLNDDDGAFEYLPDDRHMSAARASSPSPSLPPPPPPAPPVLPFRNTQRVRVKSVNLPPSQSTTGKSHAVRRATVTEPTMSGTRAHSSSLALGRRPASSSSNSSPRNNRSRGSVAASILGSGKAVQEREVAGSPHLVPSPSLIPTPSVHPVDTLSKKLRQQAEELTRVYEQLETQRKQVVSFKTESQAQKLEIERLKVVIKRQRDEEAKALTRRAATASTKSAAGSSGSGVATKAALSQKIKEAEQEKQRYAVATKQLEEVVADAQRFFHERQRVGTEEDGADHSTQAALEEQRAYIRVLEEVVHLRASEFQVSSHEELLVVLAELRHTIYEQEKELATHKQKASDVESQLLEESQAHLQVREELDSQRRQFDSLSSSARAHESEMRQQLLSVQRELQQHRDQLHQALATCDQLRHCERDLERRLSRESAEMDAARTRLEQAVRVGDEAKERLAKASVRAEDASQQAKHWESEAARRQAHLDEVNALQEELLDSIAEASAGQDRETKRAKELERMLRDTEQREKETASKLEDLAARTEREKQQLKQRLDELKRLNEQVDTECATLREQVQGLDESLAVAQRQILESAERADSARQKLEIHEKEAYGRREAAAQLEAALTTALQVITAPRQGSQSMYLSAEGCLTSSADGEQVDLDCASDLMDSRVVEDMRACCAALGSLLPSDNDAMASWPDVSLPSLRELLQQLMLASSRVLSEVEQSSGSWTRERRDLQDACAALEEANVAWQLEASHRYQQLLDYQRALSDCELQVGAMAIESEALTNQFRVLQAVFEEKRALEHRVSGLEIELERGQLSMQSRENELSARCSELEDLNAQLQVAHKQLTHQNGQLSELSELHTRVPILTSELDDALALSEDQNAWNQQLASEVERREEEAVTQCALIRELEARERAFARRFSQLFEQFAAEGEPSDLPAIDPSHMDVLALMQSFPMVVEQYVARCTTRAFAGHLQTTASASDALYQLGRESIQKSSLGRRKGTDKARQTAVAVEKLVDRDSNSVIGEFDNQLELIRAAFQAIRHDPTSLQ